MHTYEQLFGGHEITVAQALLTRKDLQDRLGYLNVRNTLLALLELKVIPIVNENDVVFDRRARREGLRRQRQTFRRWSPIWSDADLLALLGSGRRAVYRRPACGLLGEADSYRGQAGRRRGPGWTVVGRSGAGRNGHKARGRKTGHCFGNSRNGGRRFVTLKC